MKNVSIVSFIFAGILIHSVLILPTHTTNDRGQSELIQYVIKQDALIHEAEKNVDTLKSKCSNQEVSGSTSRHRTYKLVATPSQLRSLADAQEKLNHLVDATSKKIESIASSHPSQLSAQDNFGKTALNYCYTDTIYYKLRDVGAPFQYDAWLYFNGANLAALLVATGMLTAFGINWLKKPSKNIYEESDTENQDKDRDENKIVKKRSFKT